MARDPLGALLKIRRHGVDQLRRHVAACLEAERRMEALVEATDDQIRRNVAAQTTIPAWIAASDPFGRAIAALAERRQVLNAELSVATRRTQAGQHALANARMAVEAVEALIQRQEDATQLLAERREQHALDDIARGLRRQRQSR